MNRTKYAVATSLAISSAFAFADAPVVSLVSSWPFVTVRSYGTLKVNSRFTERLIAAQTRHPGLVDEVWSGVEGALAIGTNYLDGITEDLPYYERCRKVGISIGLQYSTIGHGCDGRRAGFSDAAWIVNREGELKPGILCVTSPEARAANRRFTEEAIRLAKPDAIWPDDDLRLQKEYTAGGEICFCDRCLDLFRERSGRAVSREELVTRLFDPNDDSEETSCLRCEWADFNEHAVAGMAAVYREAIERAAPETRLGLQICDAWSRYEGAGHPATILKALSGGSGKKVALRPGGGFYEDCGPLFEKVVANVLPDAVRTMTNSLVAQVCYEAENWPHISAMKTPGTQMLECSLMLAAGCNAISLYYGADLNAEPPEDYDFYFDTLARWKPFLLAIRDAFAGTRVAGVAQFTGTHFGPNWKESTCDTSLRLLENAVPITVRGGAVEAHWLDHGAVATLAGRDLGEVFSKPVIMDAEAFRALGARFPSLDFVKRLAIDRFGAFDWGSGVKTGYEMFGNGMTAADVVCTMRASGPGVRLLSRLSTDTTGKLGCMAEVETEFGGRVIVIQSFTLGGARRNRWTHYRRRAIFDALDAVIPGGMSVRLLSPGDVQVFARVDREGRTVGAYLFNWQRGETRPLELAIRRGARSAWRVRSPAGDEPVTMWSGTEGEVVLRMPALRPASAYLVY